VGVVLVLEDSPDPSEIGFHLFRDALSVVTHSIIWTQLMTHTTAYARAVIYARSPAICRDRTGRTLVNADSTPRTHLPIHPWHLPLSSPFLSPQSRTAYDACGAYSAVSVGSGFHRKLTPPRSLTRHRNA
jgi:hypothetical protein